MCVVLLLLLLYLCRSICPWWWRGAKMTMTTRSVSTSVAMFEITNQNSLYLCYSVLHIPIYLSILLFQCVPSPIYTVYIPGTVCNITIIFCPNLCYSTFYHQYIMSIPMLQCVTLGFPCIIARIYCKLSCCHKVEIDYFSEMGEDFFLS
jgi:hypothetical protein